jgi:hypothetical protein
MLQNGPKRLAAGAACRLLVADRVPPRDEPFERRLLPSARAIRTPQGRPATRYRTGHIRSSDGRSCLSAAIVALAYSMSSACGNEGLDLIIRFCSTLALLLILLMYSRAKIASSAFVLTSLHRSAIAMRRSACSCSSANKGIGPISVLHGSFVMYAPLCNPALFRFEHANRGNRLNLRFRGAAAGHAVDRCSQQPVTDCRSWLLSLVHVPGPPVNDVAQCEAWNYEIGEPEFDPSIHR